MIQSDLREKALELPGFRSETSTGRRGELARKRLRWIESGFDGTREKEKKNVIWCENEGEVLGRWWAKYIECYQLTIISTHFTIMPLFKDFFGDTGAEL